MAAVRPSYLTMLAALAAALAGCAGMGQPRATCEERAMRMHACIDVRNLAQWDSLDDRALLIWPPDASRAYLVNLTSPLPELTAAEAIDMVDADLDGQICACGRDAVFIGGAESGVIIATIEFLSKKRTAEIVGASQGMIRTSLGE